VVKKINKKYIFFDRDGTLNLDPGYISSVNKFNLYKDTIDSLKLLSKNNFKFFLITNQSGIGRGLISLEELEKIHRKFDLLLMNNNLKFEDKYFCPHLPSDKCKCRKPEIEMFLKASYEYSFNISESIVIGDSVKDIMAAKKIGALSVLVKTGEGCLAFERLKKLKTKPDFVCENLYQCALFLTKGLKF